jgi:serine/threonine protein kinase
MGDSPTLRIEDLFHRVADLPADQRAAFLAEHCGDDATLRAAVEELLRHDTPETADSALRSPVASQREALRQSTTPQQIGPYRIVSTLGQGGMGVVYEAEQLRPVKRTVAIKVIKLGMDTSEVIARFDAERQALAMMDHPGIARVYDAGATETGRPYFVMEFVRGVPITRYCDEKTLSTQDRLQLFAKVCDAVQHAHMKGIIHRDLKPGNILVTEIDGEPSPKVIDFGIVKATSTSLTERTLQTEMGQLLGTPEYMSPEQARPGADGDVDTRSDVYSLGAVLYELLSGSQPFDATSLRAVGYQELARIIRDTDPPRPSTRITRKSEDGEKIAALRQETVTSLSNRLRRELEWIPLMAMRKERDQRYRSAAELADDVRAYLVGRPLIAAPQSRAYRVRKFLRRNRRGVAALAAMFFLLIGGIITTTIQAIRANREKAEAQRRFNDVRALARGMIFDVQDEVVKLPGSQEATRKMIDLSKQYLEKLQAERSSDVALILDVAQAYGRLAEIQGGVNTVSKNDMSAWRNSWEKSLELANRAAQLAPTDPRSLQVAASAEFNLSDAERRLSGRLDVASERLSRALQLFTAAANMLPDDPRPKSDAILTQTRIARVRYDQSRITEAIDLQSRAVEQARALLAKYPQNRDLKSRLAGALADLEPILERAGDFAGAEKASSESTVLYESLLAAEPHNSKIGRLLAHRYVASAHTALSRRDTVNANRSISLAMQHARSMAAADNTSRPLQGLLVDVLYEDADLKSRLTQNLAATESLNEAIAICEKLLAANPTDELIREKLGVCYDLLATLLERQHKYSSAINAVSKAVEVVRAGPGAGRTDLRMQAGMAYYERVIAQLLMKESRYFEAIVMLRRSLAVFERLVVDAPGDALYRRNLAISRNSLADALIASSNMLGTNSAQGARMRAEATKLLVAARDGYAQFLKSEKPLPDDVKVVDKLDKQLADLGYPTTQPRSSPATQAD